MSNVVFGITFKADGSGNFVGEAKVARDAIKGVGDETVRTSDRARASMERLNSANSKMASQYSGMTQSVTQHTAAVTETERSVTKLLDKYDPLGVKLRQLQADYKALNEAASSGKIAGADDGRVDQVYAQMRKEMDATGKASVDLGLNTQYARREIMMLGKEALSGDFSRMPQTFGALATHSNLLAVAMSPVGMAITAVAGAAIGLAAAFIAGQREAEAMNNAIAYTGVYAGVARGQMIALAEGISQTSTLSIGAAKEVVTQLVNSGRVGAESLGAIAQMADTYAAATGANIDKVGADLAKLFDDPVKGAAELNNRMHFLNSAELEYIDHLVKIGDEEQARLVLAEKFNASVPKHVENIGLLESAWNKAAGAASFFWDKAKGVGRDTTNEDALQRDIDRIAALNAAGVSIPEWLAKDYAEVVALMNIEAASAAARGNQAQEQERQIKDVALARQASTSARVKDIDAEMGRLNELYTSEKASAEERLWASEAMTKKQKELNDLLHPKVAQSETQKEIKAQGEALSKLNESITAHIAVLSAQDGAETKLTESQKKLVEMSANYKKGLTAQNEAAQQSYIASLAQAAGMELAAEAQKEADKAAKDATKTQQDYMAGIGKETDELLKKAAAAELENAKIGMTAEQLALLVSKRYDDAIAIEEQRAAVLRASGEQAAELHVIEQKIDALNRLKSAETMRPYLENQKKANDEMNRGLTDALMRGWESGKGFARNFVDTVTNMFNTMVLRPVISAIMAPVSGAITAGMGALGVPGMANAGGVGNASSIMNLASLGTSLTSFGSAFSVGMTAGSSAAASYAAAAAANGAAAQAIGFGLAAAAPIAAVLAIPLLGQAMFGGDTSFGAPRVYGTIGAGGLQSEQIQNQGTWSRPTMDGGGVYTPAPIQTVRGYTGTPYTVDGGWFGGDSNGVSNKTGMSDAQAGQFDAAITGIHAGLERVAAITGLATISLDGWTFALDHEITTSEQMDALINDISNSMAGSMIPKLSLFAEAGEGAGDVAVRLANAFGAVTPAIAQIQQSVWQAWSPETVAMVQNAGAVMQDTTYQVYQTQTRAVTGLLNTFDGSVAATNALAQATQQRYQTELQLVNQIASAMGNLHTMLNASAESINLSMMSQQEKQTYYVNQANSLQAQLFAATDPAQIESLTQQWNTVMMNGWNSLDDTQRKAMQAAYLADIAEVNAFTQDTLGETLDSITATSETDLPAQIADAITAAMDRAAAKQGEAAGKMADAAGSMQQAANSIPRTIGVNIDFSANVPGTSQVGVLP